MKKKYLISGITALTILISAAGLTSAALASDTGANANKIFNKFFGQKGEKPQVLTDAQKTEMQAKLDAVKAALAAGDYNAWVAAVKAQGKNSQVLEKINSGNFSRYVEANKLREQADSIFKELGVNGCGIIGGKSGGHGMMGDFGFGGPNGDYNK